MAEAEVERVLRSETAEVFEPLWTQIEGAPRAITAEPPLHVAHVAHVARPPASKSEDARLGWDEAELFGVCPHKPWARFDRKGVAFGRAVQVVTANAVVYVGELRRYCARA